MSRLDDAQIVDSRAKNTDPWTDAMIKNHDTSILIAHLTAEATYFE